MAYRKHIRLATRGSELALVQAEEVAAHIEKRGFGCEIVKIRTRGDRDKRSLRAIGEPGMFTKALEEAILAGRADAAVHSAKDLPTKLPANLAIWAVSREDPRDAFISTGGATLAELPAGSVVGTSSPRRAAAVLALRRDLVVKSIRGNVPTRLRKVWEGQFGGVILAVAGIRRLGMEKSITEVFEPDIMLPAAGQGTIVVEARRTGEAAAVFEGLCNGGISVCLAAERAVLRALGAGCRTAAAALCVPSAGGFSLQAAVWSTDGAGKWEADTVFESGGEEEAGARVAQVLFERGAGEVVGRSR